MFAVYDAEANANASQRFPRLGYTANLLDAVADADLILALAEWDELNSDSMF